MSNYVSSTNYNKLTLDNKLSSSNYRDVKEQNINEKWQSFVLALRMQYLSSYADGQKIYNHNVSVDDLKTSFIKSEEDNKTIEKKSSPSDKKVFEKTSSTRDKVSFDSGMKNNFSKDTKDLKIYCDNNDRNNIAISMVQEPMKKIAPLVKVDNLSLCMQQVAPKDVTKQNQSKEKGSENFLHEIKPKEKLGKILKPEITSPEKLNERYKQNSEWIKKLANDFRAQLQQRYPHIYVPAFHPDFGGVDITIRFNKNGLQNAKFTSSSKDLLNLLYANKNDFYKIFAKHLNKDEEQVQNLIDFHFQE
jgi:hypothetical protein